MKRFLPSAVALISFSAGVASAAITVPGANSSDGVLSVGSNISIDLSQAANGPWDSNSPTAGKGVYDGDKWAVVFHYTSVNMTGGSIVFKNHPSHAPVVWLVSGDVTLNGIVSLDGAGGYVLRLLNLKNFVIASEERAKQPHHRA